MILNKFSDPTYFPGYPDGHLVPVMRPEGTGAIPLMLMGEALGRNEAKDQLPFRPYAEAGSVLERALRLCGIDRQQLLISNLVWYQPPHDWLEGAPWEHEAISMCAPWNDNLVQTYRPKCILALGGSAWRVHSGMAGRRQGILLTRGFPKPSVFYSGVTVLGTYHPSYLRRGEKEEQSPDMKGGSAAGRGMDLLGVLVHDIQLALAIARGQWGPAGRALLRDYREHAGISMLEYFYQDALAHPDLPIAYDIETEDTFRAEDESEIAKLDTDVTQIQFSLRPGEAIILDWRPEIIPLVKSILSLPNDKLDYNGRLSDRLVLSRKHGIQLSGTCHDLMDAWHHIQPDLPKGLQYATSFFCPEFGPWKHLDNTARHWYGGCDVDAPQRIWPTLQKDMQHMGVWKSYLRHINQLGAIVLDSMSHRGIRIEETERLAFGAQIDQQAAEVKKEIQSLAPAEILPLHPKDGYKVPPADLKQAILAHPMDRPVEKERIVTAKGAYILREIEEGSDATLFEITKYRRWFRVDDFNPNSRPQVLDYIKYRRAKEINDLRARGRSLEQAEKGAKYKIPKDFKKQTETTGKKELIRLARATGDLLIPRVIESREFSKLKGTYVEGWNPRFSHYRDGRVHPSFKFAPATGQLSTEEPNSQNVPKKSHLADAFRKMIVPSPGHVLIEFDYRSFHALTLGFEAQDPSYMRLARLDIHSFFAACGLLKLWHPDMILSLTDDELRDRLAWVKQHHGDVRDKHAKPTILGYGFGMGPSRLYYENVETISNVAEARSLIDSLNGLFPITAKFRRDILRRCVDGGGYLLSLHGYIRRFWNVFEHKPVTDRYQPKEGEKVFIDGRGQRWKVAQAGDAEAVIAFLPANDAHGHIKEVMLDLAHDASVGVVDLLERYGLINMIHDSLIFDCPRELAEECIEIVKPLMERRSTYLVNPVAPQGLWCEVEVSMGMENWAKRSSSNPGGMGKVISASLVGN